MPTTPSNRIITVGAAQLGPISLDETRAEVVDRLIGLLEKAREKGCGFGGVSGAGADHVLSALALRGSGSDRRLLSSGRCRGQETQALFDKAADYRHRLLPRLCGGWVRDRWERTAGTKRYNTCILVDQTGAIVGKYRKVHLPGHAGPQAGAQVAASGKGLFRRRRSRLPGLAHHGRGSWALCICNDRRWPETYRVMGPAGGGDDHARLQHAGDGSRPGGSSRPIWPACTTISPCSPAPIRTPPG